MNITYASTWDTRCGIAEYSHSLVHELEKHVKVEVVNIDPGQISSPARLAARLNQGDVAHIQHQYPFFGGMSLFKNWFRQAVTKVEVPLVVTVHELDLGFGDLAPIRSYKRFFNKFLFDPPEIYRFIVHSEDFRDKMGLIGVAPEDISIIPEGVPKVNRVRISSQNAKILWEVSDKRVITIFGFVTKRKGYELALKALKELPNDVVLIIAGGAHPDDKTGFYDDLKETIAAMRLHDRVRITDYLQNHEVATIMAATDLIIAPFTSMSNSGSILRAIAYRKPILTSDLPPNRELNARCKGVWLFRSGDANDLARCIKEMLGNRRILTAASALCREYAEEWSVAKAAEATVDVYREVLEQ